MHDGGVRATLHEVFQVRFHGRGGQGVVTAAELLARAAFAEGRHAQAFPSFGSERTGAPVVSFCRIADGPIRTHEPVVAPDALIVQDPTLLHQVDLFDGLVPDGYLLINSRRGFAELGLAELEGRFRPERLLTVPASDLALEHIGRPLPNAVMLGGLAAISGVVSLDALATALRETFREAPAAANIAGATAAFAVVRAELEALAC